MAKGIDNKSANGHNRSRNADDMNPQGPHTSFPPSVQMGRPLTFSDRVTPEETYTVTDVVNNIRLGDTGWRDEFLNMLQDRLPNRSFAVCASRNGVNEVVGTLPILQYFEQLVVVLSPRGAILSTAAIQPQVELRQFGPDVYFCHNCSRTEGDLIANAFNKADFSKPSSLDDILNVTGDINTAVIRSDAWLECSVEGVLKVFCKQLTSPRGAVPNEPPPIIGSTMFVRFGPVQ
eukprot:GHVL01030988.1.p1 GENE.GHVL01030988.1~~GHVL01030988.1.p1  ORF type:complete len:233 (+),score=41.65 GHVL01030988.1:411-1109(+)